MKIFFKNWLAFVIVTTVFLFQNCTSTPEYNVEKVTGKLNIEKENSEIWSKIQADTVNGQIWGGEMRTSLNDFNVIFKSLWDTSGLYFRFEIWDDKKCYNPLIWRELNDNILLYFCPKLKKVHKLTKGDVVSFFFSYGKDTTKTNTIDREIIKAQMDKEGVCVLQIKIPWNKIGLTPIPNLKIPFNIVASDLDHAEQQGEGFYMGRETRVSWGREFIMESLGTADGYGDLILRE